VRRHLFAIQTLKVNDLLADSKREQRFVLFDGVGSTGSPVSRLSTDSLVEILTGQIAQRFAQRGHGFCQSLVFFFS